MKFSSLTTSATDCVRLLQRITHCTFI